MRSPLALGVAAGLASVAAAADPKYILYYDQYHTTGLPNKTMTAGINYVITAFANSSLFAAEPAGEYTPFESLDTVRSRFDDGTKVCMAIGGWGDTAGFSEGAKTAESRKRYAANVADTLDRLGYDCIDVDWEYPAGNGADYRQIPNSEKVSEIETYPLLLAAIKEAIGTKELSIAVPGLERDMIAYTAEKVPEINKVVDFVNVMTYDLISRRDNFTGHHTSVQGTLDAVDAYIQRGFAAEKLVFGFPFYAKWFTTVEGEKCTSPIGCPMELLEDAEGADTGKSGAITFEKGNFVAAPTNLTTSTDTSCGVGTFFKCGEGDCCSQYGWCGDTAAHCGTGCQSAYGHCDGTDVLASFQKALKNGKTDVKNGGQWYWDEATRLFWTWDTPELITQKIWTLMGTRNSAGFMAWSLGEDGYDWSHLKAMQDGFNAWKKVGSSGFKAKAKARGHGHYH